jgi:hypothetical protein
VWQIRLATATTHTEEESLTRSSGYLYSRCRILLVLIPCDQFAWQKPRSAGSDSEKDIAAPNLAILAKEVMHKRKTTVQTEQLARLCLEHGYLVKH